MQKKTKYCNSLVSKVLPTINEIGDNNLIFNQIDNSLCFRYEGRCTSSTGL